MTQLALVAPEQDTASGASFDADKVYRYHLWRRLGCGGVVTFVMLNPSTADADHDDPTIRRCMGFVRSWGYGHLNVVNLFAYRATSPADLAKAVDPVGDGNDIVIDAFARSSNLMIAAWGCHGILQGRDKTVLELLRGIGPVHHLGLTRGGHPRHPLYIRADTQPILWEGEP